MALLERTVATLPAAWYYDPAQYARELEAIWYRDWVCVGRAEELREAGEYVVESVGDESLILTRDRGGRLRAFHNACRHRGSSLCTASRGRFAGGRIVCPYHAWTYALSGELIATPKMEMPADFSREDYPLYAANVDSWGGFLFVNLSGKPASSLKEFLGAEADVVRRWPLAELVSVHREVSTVACNWKVFWENYSECYHCPGLHPELCRIMPLFREGLVSYEDSAAGAPQGDARPRVAPGFVTWTLDGQSSLFVVAHPDYVRSVRILPRGPERVELTMDWLLPPGVAERHKGELEKMVELGRLVVSQDGRACELNQRGLRSRRHHEGVLMPQEQPVQEFHEWLRARLREPA